MCSHDSVKTKLVGSAKGGGVWEAINGANLYYACPYHSPLDHALTIDFALKNDRGQRVALELSADSALALAESIQSLLAKELNGHPPA